MNPEEAYRLHTDWARAVQRRGTASADWMTARMAAFCQPNAHTPGSPRYRRLGEPQTIEAMRRTGPVRDTSIVVGYQPDHGEPAGHIPTDVYPEPTPEPEPMSFRASDVLVPEEVYLPVTVDQLVSSPTYYVTSDMCTVMEVAAAAFDEYDRMPTMPTHSGFVVLARPISLPMGPGAPQQVRAFAWNTWGKVTTSLGQSGDAGEVWTFASRAQDTDMQVVRDAQATWPSRKAWETEPDLLAAYVDGFVTGSGFPPVSEPAAISDARVLAHRWFAENTNASIKLDASGAPIPPSPEKWDRQLTAMQARFDQHLAEESAKHPDQQYGFWQPYLAAFVLLLTQQITVASQEPVDATSARLAQKVSRSRPTSVTVVDVRHARRTGDDETSSERQRGALTHRHLVGSHWKWQPYGQGRALRRRIFVSGYVRGPEDAPLVTKPRVTRL